MTGKEKKFPRGVCDLVASPRNTKLAFYATTEADSLLSVLDKPLFHFIISQDTI